MAGCDNNNGGVVVEETASSSSSAKSKVKFMCSHGGRILPRSTDGQLKYVGGETRVIAIPRNISFSGFYNYIFIIIIIEILYVLE